MKIKIKIAARRCKKSQLSARAIKLFRRRGSRSRAALLEMDMFRKGTSCDYYEIVVNVDIVVNGDIVDKVDMSHM